MTEEHKDRIYQGVRRMVIWDEPRADVFYRLEVNGLDPEQAKQMYDKARAERIAIIRGGAAKQAILGFLLLAAGLGALLWLSIGPIFTRQSLALCAVAVVFGTWNFSKGLIYFLFAHTKKGSLADED